ncbi:hypothetical protein EDB85DRAFT_2200840 [Lactarius pseudohatsudake]|nr:hypothetical protein EDB85DRAFT_2200840 [Lactarius pseudohatsudake]
MTSVRATTGVSPDVSASFPSNHAISAIAVYLKILGSTNHLTIQAGCRVARQDRRDNELRVLGPDREDELQYPELDLCDADRGGQAPIPVLAAALTNITRGSNPSCSTNGLLAATGWDPTRRLIGTRFLLWAIARWELLHSKEYARSDFQKTPPGVVTSTATRVTLPINFDNHSQDHARDHDYDHDHDHGVVIIDHWHTAQLRPSSINRLIKLSSSIKGRVARGAQRSARKRECRLVPQRSYLLYCILPDRPLRSQRVIHRSIRSPIAFVTCNWSYGHHVVDVNIQKPSSRAVHSATVVGAALRASLSLGSIGPSRSHWYSGELVAEFVVGLGAARFPGRFQSLIARLALLHEESRCSESRTGRTLMTFASTGINDSEAAILGQGRRGIVATTGGNVEGDRGDSALASYYLDHSVDLG